MTCEQALKFVDALPFLDRAQRAQLDQHLSGCAQCQVSWERLSALESGWSTLPEPAPPEDLAATVLLRIEQESERRSLAQQASEVEEQAATILQPSAVNSRRESIAWAALLLGFLTSLGVQGYSLLTGETTFYLGSIVRGGTVGLAEMPAANPSAFVLIAGLLLYVFGWFGAYESPPQSHPDG